MQHYSLPSPPAKIVIKVGSSQLIDNQGISNKKIKKYCDFINLLRKKGYTVFLITSGAVACGQKIIEKRLNIKLKKDIPEKQALSAIGQVILMEKYKSCLESYQISCAQILLSENNLSNPNSRKNAKATLENLIKMNCLPIVNENDSVATEELRFGDNDTLASLFSELIQANLLIILSDIDGYYEDFDTDKQKRISYINKIDSKMIKSVQKNITNYSGTGGILSKLLAAKKSSEYGIPTFITSGDLDDLYQSCFVKLDGTYIEDNTTFRLQK